MVSLKAEENRGHPAPPSICSSASSTQHRRSGQARAAPAWGKPLRSRSGIAVSQDLSQMLGQVRHRPRARSALEESLGTEKTPGPARLLALIPFGAQPERAERGQAGGPGYVMGFTGHQLSILLFTLFSLAKCKRFFPSTVER